MATGSTDAVQDIHFARSADGVGIAYAVHGSGPPLLIDACWLSHLQFDWQSPVWRHYLVELGRVATVIRYDERGHGLSDRGVTDHSLEARVADLEAVADGAGPDRFALLAMSQGGPVAIEYAARHLERLTRLAFYGSYAGAQVNATPEQLELDAAFELMIKVGWARPTSEFRRVLSWSGRCHPSRRHGRCCWTGLRRTSPPPTAPWSPTVTGSFRPARDVPRPRPRRGLADPGLRRDRGRRRALRVGRAGRAGRRAPLPTAGARAAGRVGQHAVRRQPGALRVAGPDVRHRTRRARRAPLAAPLT